MQRRHGAMCLMLEERKVQQVDVEMQDVELPRAAAHLVQHREVRGHVRFERRGIQTDRAVAHRDQLGVGVRIGGCEQRDFVTELHQRVAQIRDDALGAAIQLRRNGFGERRDLGDVHGPNNASCQKALRAKVRVWRRQSFPKRSRYSRGVMPTWRANSLRNEETSS